MPLMARDRLSDLPAARQVGGRTWRHTSWIGRLGVGSNSIYSTHPPRASMAAMQGRCSVGAAQSIADEASIELLSTAAAIAQELNGTMSPSPGTTRRHPSRTTSAHGCSVGRPAAGAPLQSRAARNPRRPSPRTPRDPSAHAIRSRWIVTIEARIVRKVLGFKTALSGRWAFSRAI
jgi:hypothetical protein